MKPKEKLAILTIATGRLIDAVKLSADVPTALQQAESAVGHFVQGPKKKQPTRLLKAICNEESGGCGYTVRVSRLWLELAVPVCPNPDCKMHKKPMDAETDATTMEERVNVYHKSKENSLSRMIDETGTKREKSKREKTKDAKEKSADHDAEFEKMVADGDAWLNEKGKSNA